jgi:hypothetical protein
VLKLRGGKTAVSSKKKILILGYKKTKQKNTLPLPKV